MFRFNSLFFTNICLIIQLSGCALMKGSEIENVDDALTAGIFLEKTRGVVPESVILKEVYQKGIDLTKVSEGFRHKLYNDAAGYCTIGYGHLIKKRACDGSEEAQYLPSITEARGEEILVVDMNWAKYSVAQAVSVDLTEGQYAALVDFVFNVGSGNFKKSTLLKKINAGQHDNVPFQLRRWIRAGGKVWPGLVTRREKEIDLYLENTAIPRLLPKAGEVLTEIDIRMGE